MIKNLILFALLAVGNAFGQTSINTTSANNHVPQVFPPTPSVASLMKFEEIKVGEYTGVPNISVPIYSVKGNNNFNLNLSINYHSSNIKKEDIAGYTGLGWSLFAGGSISRTVMDIPDEYNQKGSSNSGLVKKKIGIYSDSNNFYSVLPLLKDDVNYDINNYEINKFLFEASEKQSFDTKHDLYQYNFMGYTGKFIIIKNNNEYQVKKLTKDNLIINYNSNNKTFEIIDDMGFHYIFDTKEYSNIYSTTANYSVNGALNDSFDNPYLTDYISSFHLSNIYYNQNKVAEFLYNNDNEVLIEEQTVRNQSNYWNTKPGNFNQISNLFIDGCPNIDNMLPPKTSFTSNTTITKTKKIKQIKLINSAIIEFSNSMGKRQDYNIERKEQIPYLSEIKIKDWDNNLIKSFVFDYEFSHKLFLKKVKEKLRDNIQEYSFEYKKNLIDFKDYNTDFWGYYKNEELEKSNLLYQKKIFYNDFEVENRNVDSKSIDTDILTKIKYPTGGVNIFQYEPNTYSYIGSQSFDNFENNLDNWESTPINDIYLYSSHSKERFHSLGQVNINKKYFIYANISNNEGVAGFLNLYKKNNSGQIVETIPIVADYLVREYNLEAGYQYDIGFVWNHLGQMGTELDPNLPEVGYSEVHILEKIKKNNQKKWLYGGGVRIKNIYVVNNEDIIFDQEGLPTNYEKKVSYNYNYFNDQNRSSGSLVYPEPVTVYKTNRYLMHGIGNCNIEDYELEHIVNTKLNNLSAILTQGSDVGYKNVTRFETGNGKTQYSFTSPIDFPEEFNYVNIRYPYSPTANVDYKRGLLELEENFDESNKILRSTSNQYEYEDQLEVTGLSTFYNTIDCPWSSSYRDYEDYNSKISSPNCTIGSLTCFNAKTRCGKPTDFILKRENNTAFGWSKLKSTEVTEYFYNTPTPNYIKNTTNYTYNSTNMLIKSSNTQNSKGETLTTEYQYPPDWAGNVIADKLTAQNRISEPLTVVQKNNGIVISGVYNEYNGFNGIVQKSGVFQKKGSSEFSEADRKITYNSYDEKGNLTQYTLENGIPVAIIWGYGGQYPVLKVEGATYSEVMAKFDSGALGAINNGSITSTSFDAYRPLFPNAMITSYIYQPLIGVTSITGPNGQTEYYNYDSSNRLQSIVNDKKEVIKTFEYNYKQP